MALLLPYFQERDTLSRIPMGLMEPSTSGAGDHSPATVATPPTTSPTEETTNDVEEIEESHHNLLPQKKSRDYQSPSAQLMKFMIDSHKKQQQQSRFNRIVNRNPPEKRHPIRNFLDSIEDTIITFYKMEQHIAKDKIYDMISEMEFEHLVNASSSKSISDGESSLSPDQSV